MLEFHVIVGCGNFVSCAGVVSKFLCVRTSRRGDYTKRWVLEKPAIKYTGRYILIQMIIVFIIYISETNIESIYNYLYRTWRFLFVEDAGELRQDTKKSNVKQSLVKLRILNICNHSILPWAQSLCSPQFVGVYHSTHTNTKESII